MKIAPNRKDIGDYFVSWGWLALVVVVLSYTAWYWGITALDSVKANEKINFFIESYGLKETTLSDDICAKFKDQGVVESNLYNYSPKDTSIATYYTKFGSESDFIILYQSDLDTMFKDVESSSVLSSFVPFSSALKTEAVPGNDYVFYSVNSIDYALKVFDPNDSAYNTNHPFDKLIDFAPSTGSSESAYLLLNSLTPNFKPYDENATTSNGILVLRYFLSLYHV